MSKLLTVHEAAIELRCSARTVRRLINSGRLKTVRLGSSGKSDRIHAAELDEFMRRGEERGCSESAVELGRSLSIGAVPAIADLLATGRGTRPRKSSANS